MADNWYVGNAAIDSKDRRGWIVGHFLDQEDGIRVSDEVEVKWGIHPAGDARHDWQTDEHRTTVILLVSGQFRIELSAGTFVLKDQGDYAMWGPSIDHSWHAEEDSIIITVRWPSAARPS
jgi:hypothetical protein